MVSSTKAGEGLQALVIDIGARGSSYSKGGQYLQMKVGDSKPAFIAVASAPSGGKGALELLIKNQGGTSELLTNLKAGDS